jgi:hypothetical protein
MQPDYNFESYGYQPKPRKSRKKWFVAGAVILLLLIGTLILLPSKQNSKLQSQAASQSYAALPTSLTVSDNFGYLNGNELYGYNGLAFYKSNLQDGTKLTILNNGMKLPKPSAIYWANSKGALLNFSQSFATSRIEEVLKAQKLSLNNETKNYTWYLDFATGSLHFVDYSSIRPGFALYDAKANGFYYIGNNSTSNARTTKLSLRFYNVATYKAEDISKDLGVTSVSFLSPCNSNHRLCFASTSAKDYSTKQILYGITADNKIQKIHTVDGNIYPTNNRNYFLTTDLSKRTASSKTADLPTALYNPNSNTSIPLDFKAVGAADVLVHFSSDTHFSIITNTSSIDYPRSSRGENSEVQSSSVTAGILSNDSSNAATGNAIALNLADGSSYKGSVIGENSYSNTGPLLGITEDGAEVLVTETGQQYSIPTTADQKKVSDIITSCIQSSPNASQEYTPDKKLFSVYFTYNSNFNASAANFGNCLAKAGSAALIGYNYYIGGTDPVNGRIVSD